MAENNGVFPELVIDMGSSGTRSSGSAKSSPLAQQVENALREVLAWRPRAGDTKGFLAALNQAFSAQEVEGRTDYTWTPRSYSVQADMGAVTGAQASIYARARAALDQSVPLLEGLTPLRSDDDEENVDAMRAIVIGKFTELVNELGQVGGPRSQRVEDYFTSLLGDNDEVGGLFGQMRNEFGFEPALVNTIDEEHNLTNYLIVVDHVNALRSSWKKLTDSGDVFLGTQLVQLDRALGVVAESVQELYFVMDSVFLGAAERQTVRLESGLTIAELFDWVERFTTEEALRMIRDGGKAGVNAFASTVTQLLELIGSAHGESKPALMGRVPQAGIHQGFTQPRIQAALGEVHQHMKRVEELTKPLSTKPVPSQIATAEEATKAAKAAADAAAEAKEANRELQSALLHFVQAVNAAQDTLDAAEAAVKAAQDTLDAAQDAYTEAEQEADKAKTAENNAMEMERIARGQVEEAESKAIDAEQEAKLAAGAPAEKAAKSKKARVAKAEKNKKIMEAVAAENAVNAKAAEARDAEKKAATAKAVAKAAEDAVAATVENRRRVDSLRLSL